MVDFFYSMAAPIVFIASIGLGILIFWMRQNDP